MAKGRGPKAIVQPSLQVPCHFSALQPLLATSYNARQIKSLLVLSLLFWQRPSFTDTQIADSPLLYREYIQEGREHLTSTIQSALSAGEAQLIIRDAFYRNPGEKLQECTDLLDVFRGWEKQNMPTAWVVPPDAPNRERYVATWNDAIPKSAIRSYDYLAIKRRFQQRAREAVERNRLEKEVPSDVNREVLRLLKSNWFSHSGIFSVLKAGGLEKSAWAQRFGLIDESAYAEISNAGFAALNVPKWTANEPSREEHEAIRHVNEIMSRSFEQVEAGDLSLLHLLTFDEIQTIRSRGAFLLDMFRTMQARNELSDDDLRQLSHALATYWKIICAEIDRLHPGGSKTKTKLGLMVARQSIVPVEEIIDGFAIVLSGLASYFIGGAVEGQKGGVRKIIEVASLRFLLQSDSTEMRRLKGILSRNAVLRGPEIADQRPISIGKESQLMRALQTEGRKRKKRDARRLGFHLPTAVAPI